MVNNQPCEDGDCYEDILSPVWQVHSFSGRGESAAQLPEIPMKAFADWNHMEYCIHKLRKYCSCNEYFVCASVFSYDLYVRIIFPSK